LLSFLEKNGKGTNSRTNPVLTGPKYNGIIEPLKGGPVYDRATRLETRRKVQFST